MLVKVGHPDGTGQPDRDNVRAVPDSIAPDAAEPDATGPGTARPAPAEPSWGQVLATTIRLWVARHWRVLAAVITAAAVAVAALAFSGVFSSDNSPVSGSQPTAKAGSAGGAAQAAATPQDQAAAWVASQVTNTAIIGCDPAVCAALEARGVAAGRLMTLAAGSACPQGASVVVTSSAAASQYAPAVIASFGSGGSRIEVRAVEPGGPAAYQAALTSDLAARVSAGSQLLGNPRITFTAQDAAQLQAGQVDSRVLVTLAALSSQRSFTVTAFGDAGPGADVLYREVTITSGSAASQEAELTADLQLVRAQVQPYLPANAGIAHPAASPAALSIGFAAPSPLGLLTATLDAARSGS